MRAALLFPVLLLTAQQEPVIRVDVQQVLVPVIVTDKKGHHVSGLHATDFQIFEDGVRQDIASFSSDTAASVIDISTAAIPKAAPAAAPEARRTFVICIDTLHTSPANAVRMREALESLFAKEKIGDAQYVLVGIGRQLQVLQSATTNPLAILQKIRAPGFQAMMSGLDASAYAAELNSLKSRMEDFCKRCACTVSRSSQSGCDGQIDTLKQSVDAEAARWTASTSALLDQFKNVVEELAKVPTGRTLILASDGFKISPVRDFYVAVSGYLPGRPEFRLPDTSGDADPALRKALQVAADRNVIIYAIDLHGSGSASPSGVGAIDAGNSGPNGVSGSLTGISGRSPGSASVRQTTLQASTSQQPNPFQAADSAAMEQLAKSTGGVYFHDPNNVLKQFRNALADGREYYVLAYAPKNPAQDGKFRRITVETANKGLSIRTKPGYWAAVSAR